MMKSRRRLRESREFDTALDAILQDLYDTNKKIETAHKLAPGGAAKAIVAGLHSDLFNKVAEFRDYIAQLKQISAAEEKPKQKSEGALREFVREALRSRGV